MFCKILELCDEFVPGDPPEFFFDRKMDFFIYLSKQAWTPVISLEWNPWQFSVNTPFTILYRAADLCISARSCRDRSADPGKLF